MKLKHLEIENFGPYKERQHISFPEQEEANIMVVFGDNMTGKTSILNAIRWSLYGKALDRNSNEMDLTDLVNKKRQEKADWKIESRLTFTADGREYELRRVAQPKDLVSQPSDSSDFEVKPYLREEGQAIEGEKIERKIKNFIPEELSKFYLFDGELLSEYQSLVKDDAGKSDMIKEDIEKLLGVPSLQDGKMDLRSLRKEARKAQEEASRHLESVKETIKIKNKKSEKLEKAKESLKKVRNNKEENIRELEKVKESLNNMEEIKKETEKRERCKKEKEKIIERKEEEKSKYYEEIKKSWKDIISRRVESELKRVEKKRKEKEEKIENLGKMRSRLEHLKKLKDKECPVCGQEVVDEEKIEEVQSEIGKLEVEIREEEKEIERRDEVKLSTSDIRKIMGSGAIKRAEESLEEIKKYELRINRKEEDIREATEKIGNSDTSEIKRLEKKKESLQELIGKDKKRESDVLSEISRLKEEIDKYDRQITENPEVREQRAGRKASMLDDLYTCFENSVDRLRDRLRDWVEQKATDAFLEMTTDKTYDSLAINQKYGLSIIDKAGDKVLNRSAGAEHVVALSLLTALNETADQPGPVVIDTPFGRLDPGHRENVLQHAPDMAEQVVFLVHAGEVDPDDGLEAVASHVGKRYEIEEIDSHESKIVSG